MDRRVRCSARGQLTITLVKPTVVLVTIHALAAPMRCSQTFARRPFMSSVTAIPNRQRTTPASGPRRMYEGFCRGGASLQSTYLREMESWRKQA